MLKCFCDLTPLPENYLNIFQSIVQCVSKPESFELWRKNELKIIFNIFCLYIQQNRYSHCDIIEIQKFMCNDNLSFPKPISLECKYLQLFHEISCQYNLQIHTLRYMNNVLHVYPDENFISYVITVIISNQLFLLVRKNTIMYTDSVIPLYIAILENVHLKSYSAL